MTRLSSHYHPVAVRSGRDPNLYTLRDIVNADPDGEGREFPTDGDYLYLPNNGTVLLTDVPDASGVEMWVKWEGLMCQGPIGDGLAWGKDPHQWIAVQGILNADDEFKVLKMDDWPRLPVAGDTVILTVHPPYQVLHIEGGQMDSVAWHCWGTLRTYAGDVIEPIRHVAISLNRRPWDE
jgi:hypothetical protein